MIGAGPWNPSSREEAFPIPKPKTEVGCAVFLCLFLGYFLKMAIQNLFNGVGIIPSLLFLLLFGGSIAAGVLEEGWRRLLVGFLGVFSWRHFVWRTDPVATSIADGCASRKSREVVPLSVGEAGGSSCPDGPEAPTDLQQALNVTGQNLDYGFEFLGFRFSYLRINAGNIDSISWSPGQGTSLAGHDMNDWSVVVWHDDIHGTRRFNLKYQPSLDIAILGSARSRQETEALGLAFLAFARAAGATLVESPERQYPTFLRPKVGGVCAGVSEPAEGKIPPD